MEFQRRTERMKENTGRDHSWEILRIANDRKNQKSIVHKVILEGEINKNLLLNTF